MRTPVAGRIASHVECQLARAWGAGDTPVTADTARVEGDDDGSGWRIKGDAFTFQPIGKAHVVALYERTRIRRGELQEHHLARVHEGFEVAYAPAQHGQHGEARHEEQRAPDGVAHGVSSRSQPKWAITACPASRRRPLPTSVADFSRKVISRP